MAAYTNAQMSRIRTLIGYGVQIDAEPRIQSAIKGTQAIADGGGQPDSAVQLQILAVIALIDNIDQQLANLDNLTFVSESSSGSKISVGRADFRLRKKGRAYIKQLIIPLGLTAVVQDYYGPSAVDSDPTQMSRLYDDY